MEGEGSLIGIIWLDVLHRGYHRLGLGGRSWVDIDWLDKGVDAAVAQCEVINGMAKRAVSVGQNKLAAASYRKALKLDPYSATAKKALKGLSDG